MVYVLLQLYMLLLDYKSKKTTSQKQIKSNILKFTNEMLLLQYSSLQML